MRGPYRARTLHDVRTLQWQRLQLWLLDTYVGSSSTFGAVAAEAARAAQKLRRPWLDVRLLWRRLLLWLLDSYVCRGLTCAEVAACAAVATCEL